ncbi:MAG TPA: sensor histidine kinase [Natronosporangium sp.]
MEGQRGCEPLDRPAERPERWRAGRHGPPGGLFVFVALVQVVGTAIAARDQPGPDPLGFGLLVLSGLALVARQRWPVPVFAVTGAATIGYTALGNPGGPTFIALLVAGITAVKAGHRYWVWGLTAVGCAIWFAITGPTGSQAVAVGAWVVGALVAGELGRAAAQQQAQQAQMHRERARVRAEQQRRQASEERLRIAQELHDVIGHHLSLINVQAGVGLHLMDSRPEQARAALSTIKQASAEALREVRSVLATLHEAGEAAPRTPPPGLDRLAELTGDAGLPVRTTTVGERRPLPAEVDRAAYRIVREALTNVRRHAGAGATATVRIEYRPAELLVRVDDDGGGAAPADGPVIEGTGIGGMRERAAALGGSLTAGRWRTGFRVEARLPVPAGVTPNGAEPEGVDD